jgi:glycosyltransferase involved in cell wall biosynthesis
MPPLSVVVITKNESAHIEKALASVAWADERLVVDAESTDDTVAKAERAGARAVVRPWPGYSEQKNAGAALAAHDWILSLDADERISDQLAQDIRSVLASEPACRGYRMPRVTWYLGRWIRSTDWFPDHQLRLYDRRAGGWVPRRVHESVRVEGTTGALPGEIQHYAYRDLSHHLRTIDRYTTLAAEQMLADGRRTSALGLLVYPPAAFLRNFLLRGGIRDGAVGLVVSTMNAYYVFLKFAKLWERQRAPGA